MMTLDEIEQRIEQHYEQIFKLFEDMKNPDPRRGKQYFNLRARIIHGHVQRSWDALDELLGVADEF